MPLPFEGTSRALTWPAMIRAIPSPTGIVITMTTPSSLGKNSNLGF